MSRKVHSPALPCALVLALTSALGIGALGRSSAAQPAPVQETEQERELSARRGIVTLEQQGRRLAIGTVLNGDGRILTALSALGHGNDLAARYHDGSTSAVRVVHDDRAWDIALLLPLDKNTRRGLKAARSDTREQPATLLKPQVIGHTFKLASLGVERVAALVGHDSQILNGAFRLGAHLPSQELGTPLLNERLEVVALVARACVAGERPCRLGSYGVPVTALRAFLREVPKTFVLPSAWIGARVETARSPVVSGVTVVEVAPGSPAHLARLRDARPTGEADIVVAVDGTPVPTKQAFSAELERHAIGDAVALLVLREGKFQSIRLVLAAAPPGQASAPKAASRPRPD